MRTFLFATVLLGVARGIWGGQICCPGLGCYENGPLFFLFPLPQCPEDMGMNIKLYTRENTITGQTISRNITPSVLKAGVRTIFLVHGWTGSENTLWLTDLKNKALAQGDYNVIIVGWKGGASSIAYIQAASNTRTVGGEIALISNNTINSGISSRALMYCVGFSLGGQVCAQAGLQGQFGRITGLDPASPVFEELDWITALNPSCADLVDVIHTSAGTTGMLRPVGHIDFYPNGGVHQPGCTLGMVDEALKEIRTLVSNLVNNITNPDQFVGSLIPDSCDHSRAHELFSESISTPCFLSRYSCSSEYHLNLFQIEIIFSNYSVFCTESMKIKQSMGFNADSYSGRGIFYLQTRDHPPYCLG